MWKINKPRGPWQTESPPQRERGKLRELLIEVEPLCIVYRLKGMRQSFRLPHAKAY